MTRMVVFIICVAVSLISFSCRCREDVSPSPEELIAATIPGDTHVLRPDPNWMAIERAHHVVKRTSVTSRYTTHGSGNTIRSKNELVTISFNVSDVVGYIEKCRAARFSQWKKSVAGRLRANVGVASEAPYLEGERSLVERLRVETGVTCEYDYESFAPEERRRLQFCIAALLEEGSFMIAVNDTGEMVREIFVCEYSWVRGPADGHGGRVFFLPDGREFFRTMDWIS